jgi:hypothetical protein
MMQVRRAGSDRGARLSADRHQRIVRSLEALNKQLAERRGRRSLMLRAASDDVGAPSR